MPFDAIPHDQAQFYNAMMSELPFLPDFRTALARRGVDSVIAGLAGGLIYAAYVAGTATGFRSYEPEGDMTRVASTLAAALTEELAARVAAFLAASPPG